MESVGDDWLACCYCLTRRVERLSATAVTLDLGICTNGEAQCALRGLLRRLDQRGVPARVGIGPTAVLAQLALLAAPLQQYLVSVAPTAAPALEWLQTIPGVGQRTAEVLVAEIGVDLSRFPSAGHLASWAGLCPGNDENAGKRGSGRTRKGSPWLRTALVEVAHAAARTKDTYLTAQYRRLAARRGAKRAAVAVA